MHSEYHVQKQLGSKASEEHQNHSANHKVIPPHGIT